MTSTDLLPLDLPITGVSLVRWGQLYGAAQSLAVAHAVKQHAGTICVVTDSAATADGLERALGFFLRGENIRRFSDYETLPYDAFSPPQELIAERLSTLATLANAEPSTLIVNAQALLTRLPSPGFIAARSMSLDKGDTIERESLRKRLISHGYLHAEKVLDPGEFAVRGSLLDIFPTGATTPIRIDLFDDEVESLRTFDPETQLSTGAVDRIRILPAREFPFDREAIRVFRENFRINLPGEPNRSRIYRDISDANLPAGIEYFLPLFFEETCSLFDYLPADTLIIEIEGAYDGLDAGWALIQERHEQLSADVERPILDPDVAFWSPEALRVSLRSRQRVEITSNEFEAADSDSLFNAGTAHSLSTVKGGTRDPFEKWLGTNEDFRTLIVTASPGRREILKEVLKGRGYEPSDYSSWQQFVNGGTALGISIGELDDGMVLREQRLRIVTAEQLGVDRPRQRTRRRRRSTRDPDTVFRELTDLRIGAPVVHEEHGVGRYCGLMSLDVHEIDNASIEYLVLEYADADKLYVPVHNLHLVTRYTGASPELAPLHRLGSDQWDRAKRKAAQKARDVAAELLDIYARRAARRGIAIPRNDDLYQKFALEFPFEETADQHETIEQTLADLASERPTDRVVCGDVGFGKTEVALRAAFVTAHGGYQVAILVPTTLLAQQHHRTFSDRFADWPVRVELLSRFRTGKASASVIDGLADGSVDIIVGTHKLLGSGITFKRLGLVIVDEEHRFGVHHKERLKALRSDVDTLTLTATPIPRTLNMAIGGLRDLSLIATAPADRLSVKTFVGQWSNQAIREAVLREIRRGGQVYFVHNRVKDIEKIETKLTALLPEASIRIAHGQMSERELETVVLDFYHRRFNVLVCTTIIESGIDIPTANTIIINRADHLGLAQLHQLRGRVGRSHHQAYAYLIAPPQRQLTADAAKRLEAVEALEELGAGFTLATHDLEIRGAGELLGDEQSGQIQAIGFSLYNDLLARAVASLRAGKEPNLDDPISSGTEIEIGLAALIPEDYMLDVHMRLVHYKRIASARTTGELEELQVELIDRFGLLPPQTKTLFALTHLKLLAQQLGIEKVHADSRGGYVSFSEATTLEPLVLVGLMEDQPEIYALDGPSKLRFTWNLAHEEDRIEATESLLYALGASDGAATAA